MLPPAKRTRALQRASDQEMVLHALGRLEAGLEALRGELSEEKDHAHESREAVHQRLDTMSSDVAQVKGDIRVSAEVTAQTRETVKILQSTVEANALAVAPTVEQFEQVQQLGKVILYMIGGGGVATLVALIGWGEWIRSVVSHWLGIK